LGLELGMRGKPMEKMKPGTAQSVAAIQRNHVTLELEGIDRMYPPAANGRRCTGIRPAASRA
jgi:hypothetical protein